MQKKPRKPTRRDDEGVRLRPTTPSETHSTREPRPAIREGREAGSAEGRPPRRRVRKDGASSVQAPREQGGTRAPREAGTAEGRPPRRRVRKDGPSSAQASREAGSTQVSLELGGAQAPRPVRLRSQSDPARPARRRRAGAGTGAGAGQKAKASRQRAAASLAANPAEDGREPRDVEVLKSVRDRQARQIGRRNDRTRQALIGVGAVLTILLVLFGVTKGVSAVVRWIYTADQPQEVVVEEPAAVQPVQIDLVMVGDILQHMGVFESGYAFDGTRNYDHIFAHVASEIQGDIKVVNQETILGGEAFGFSGYPQFNGPQEMGDAEAKVGFNVVLRATNHAMDYGYDGLASEMSFWHTQHPEVAVIGAVDPNDATASVDDIYYYDKDGFRVALLNYTMDLNGMEDPRGAVSMLDEEHVRATVTAADKTADLVVVFPHWGEEYELEPVASQREMASLLVECGADVIIGGHPHVLEPVEILTAADGHKVPCFWSMGNFVSTQVDNESLMGGVAKVTMVKDAEGKCAVTACSLVPTVTHKGIGTDMTTYLLRDYTDDLAASNYLESNGTDNTSLTVAWANAFCQQLFGVGFDAVSGQVVIDPSALVAEPVAGDTAGAGGAVDGTAGADGAAGAAADGAAGPDGAAGTEADGAAETDGAAEADVVNLGAEVSA